ncbi:MAG: zinc-ribbon domain-containing protein [Reyranella sp.]|nr:zinc-ribbon domain-containing protein [Reyranella sp.]
MQVTCSNCSARYAVDPVAIGPAGRTVQCARCNHRWFEPAQTTPLPPADTVSPEGSVPDVVIRPQTPGSGLPALTHPPPKRVWRQWLAGAAVLLVILGSAAFAWRAEIAGRLPAALRPIFTLEAFRGPAAAAPKTAQARLEIDLDASKIEWIDGRYVVQGEVVNAGRAPGSTNRLRLIFRKNNDVLGERTYPLVKGPIGPGARVSFSQALDEPPSGTTDIVPAVE